MFAESRLKICRNTHQAKEEIRQKPRHFPRQDAYITHRARKEIPRTRFAAVRVSRGGQADSIANRRILSRHLQVRTSLSGLFAVKKSDRFYGKTPRFKPSFSGVLTAKTGTKTGKNTDGGAHFRASFFVFFREFSCGFHAFFTLRHPSFPLSAAASATRLSKEKRQRLREGLQNSLYSDAGTFHT